MFWLVLALLILLSVGTATALILAVRTDLTARKKLSEGLDNEDQSL